MLKNKIKAFTLVEMAVVIGVIGFLLAAILTTKNIIFKSKLDSVVVDIKKISNAIEQFEAKYGGLPGDIANATNYWSSATNGNGNGIIDSSTEALQFWYQLKLAGLLPNNFDGASSYIPATYSTGGGILAGSLEGSAYSVVLQSSLINNSVSAGKVILNLSLFPASNYTTSALSPYDAQYLDKKLDDGKPITGIFRSADGTDVTSGSCVSSGSYNTATSTAACYSQIILGTYTPTTNLTSTACTNGAFGSNTVALPCPDGYRGFYTQTCDKNGSLTTTEYFCEPIKCSGGKSYGDTITLPCPNDTIGTVTYTCGKGGFYTFSQSCALPPNSSCSGTASPSFYATYPVGFGASYGLAHKYNCSSSTISDTGVGADACSDGGLTGSIQSSQSVNTCPTYYSSSPNNTNGSATEACVLSLDNINSNNYRIIKSNCVPTFGSCGTVGSIRNPGCPYSMIGTYTQICNNEGYWETYQNTCTAVTCGGEPIGSIRVAQGKTCPVNNRGVMLEICDYTSAAISSGYYNAAVWQLSTRDCQPQQ